MNLENIDLLTQKVERVLEVMRILKTEKAQMQVKIDELTTALDERTTELTSLNDTVRGQEDEIQLAQDRFHQLLSTIEAELGTEIQIDNKEEQQGEASENNFFS